MGCLMCDHVRGLSSSARHFNPWSVVLEYAVPCIFRCISLLFGYLTVLWCVLLGRKHHLLYANPRADS